MSLGEKFEVIADSVYEKGKDDQLDYFWETFQEKGARQEWAGAFKNSWWNDNTFRPKYLIAPTNADSIFSNSAITNGELLRGKLDLSKNTNGYSNFYAAKFKTLPPLDFSSCTKIANGFGNNFSLTKIEKLILNDEGTTTFSGPVFHCPSLSYIRFEGVIGNTVTMSACPLSKDSIKSVLEHLSKTASGQTLTLKKTAVNNAFGINVTNESTYTDEWLSLINSVPNWTLSFV
ncbi:MAG: hypothetical protein IKB60_03690 [Clostridia bacterium]|nr:hypothetical protein [Clostridia bacterium]